MRTIFITVYFIGMCLTIASCSPPPKTNIPELEVPKFQIPEETKKSLEALFGCDKKDSELAISDEARKNTVTIEDTIEIQDLEKTDCDGKVEKSHGPVRDFNKKLSLSAPGEFSENVTYVMIKNIRTCSVQSFDTTDQLKGSDASTEEKPKFGILTESSEADKKGNLRILLGDSSLSFNLFTRAKEGTNILKVSYFGKCLKYLENPDEKIKSISYRCKEAQLLGSKEILVNVHIDRPEKPGVQKIDLCPKQENIK